MTLQLHTTRQAAVLLGVTTRTVRRYAREQGIPKTGRDYLLTAGQLESIRRAITEALPGNPAWRKPE